MRAARWLLMLRVRDASRTATADASSSSYSSSFDARSYTAHTERSSTTASLVRPADTSRERTGDACLMSVTGNGLSMKSLRTC